MRIRARAVAGISAASLALAMASGCAVSGKSDSGDGPVKIAYLTASAANTWLTASGKAMQEDAKKNNVEITTFDAKFTPGAAAKQVQDVISSGQYKGIIIATVDGAGVIPALQKAIKAGLKVVVLNQIIGTELDTADPQVPGVSASVLAPPTATGERVGKLTVDACADLDPCRVVFMYGQKGTPFDTALRSTFDEQIGAHPSITVIAEGQGGFLGTDEPKKATQDILQAHPAFDVLVGTGDQQIRGAHLALKAAGKTDVKLIGVGGSEPAIAGLKDGTWWGDVAGAPETEGHQAFEAMMNALDGTDDGGIDVTESLVDDGLITQANVDEFTPQWAG
ncbi:sugar ABC transporter substrate-binding protein [Pimelobacter simplex]|uniref:sugar ABC transporter substrate-binding protein n=1 Tax=Nocardioides simplex TaxID=2045 RepID=UPI003AB0D01B